MEARWLKRTDDNGNEEKFYPITHVDAIVTDDGKKLFDQEVLATQIQSLIDSGVIEVVEKVYTPSDTLLKTLVSSEISGKYTDSYYIAKWTPEKSGAVKIKCNLKTTDSSYNAQLMVISPTIAEYISSTITSGHVSNYMYMFDKLSEGAKITSGFTSPFILQTQSTSYVDMGAILEVRKGEPVYFVLTSNQGNTTAYCDTLSIYTSEV